MAEIGRLLSYANGTAEVVATIDQLSDGVLRDIDLDALALCEALELACRLGERAEERQRLAPERSRVHLDGHPPGHGK